MGFVIRFRLAKTHLTDIICPRSFCRCSLLPTFIWPKTQLIDLSMSRLANQFFAKIHLWSNWLIGEKLFGVEQISVCEMIID